MTEVEEDCRRGIHDLGIVRRNAKGGVESYWEYRLQCKNCKKQFGKWETNPALCTMPERKKIDTT